MLHPVLQKRIKSKAVALLYSSGINLNDETSELYDAVRHTIANVRYEAFSRNVDPLQVKQFTFGNRGKWAQKKIEEFNRALFTNKKPTHLNLGNWRAIEFEVIFKNKHSYNNFLSTVRQTKVEGVSLKDWVSVKEDGSLRRNEDDVDGVCKEVVLVYQKGNEELVRTLCDLLQTVAYVNKSCGTHVHFDMRHIDYDAALVRANRLARWVPALRQMLPYSRRENEYCLEDISLGDNGRRQSRYAFVNTLSYSKYRTLEVRGHSGTINANKILNWITICETIMERRIRLPKDVEINIVTLIRVYDELGPDLLSYIRSRYDKFRDMLVTEGEERLAA